MDKKITSGYPLIINYLGIFAILIGLINALPLAVIFFYPEEITYLWHFLAPSLVTIGIGLIIILCFKGREKGKLERSQDAILVVSIWMMAILTSAIPFMLTGTYNFTQSIFETTSGYSTTGLTVVDVTQTAHVFLFFRSLLQLVGGVGLVLVLTSAISDKFGMRLYSAEGHSDKLVPNLIKSGRIIMSIYLGYILVGMIFLVIFGMPVFDALNHSICAVATGGFSTQASSIGAYQNVGIEITIIVLMILGGTNFFVHLMLLRGKFKNVIGHVEIKLLGLLLVIFIPLMTVNYLTSNQAGFWESFRISAFQFVSAVTGTGYQTVAGFDPATTILPVFSLSVLIIVMVLGAGLGSTAGGMKQYRVALAFKSLWWQIREQTTHHKTIRTRFISKLGTQTIVQKEDIVQNYGFLMTYILVLVAGTLVFTAYGYSLMESLFEFSSALGTVGLSVGITGYNAPAGIHWTSIIGMFMGRLEFFVIFVAIARIATDMKRKAGKL